jgi:hypothetical protein
MHPFDKTIALTAPWQPVKILPLTQFLGLPPDLLDETSQDAIGAEFHAAFLVKETA